MNKQSSSLYLRAVISSKKTKYTLFTACTMMAAAFLLQCTSTNQRVSSSRNAVENGPDIGKPSHELTVPKIISVSPQVSFAPKPFADLPTDRFGIGEGYNTYTNEMAQPCVEYNFKPDELYSDEGQVVEYTAVFS